MLEILLYSKGSNDSFFPNSGPGNKQLLAGDKTLGYFGEVSDSELFTPAGVIRGMNFNVGTDVAQSGNIWLKFIRNEVVLFIAKKPFKTGVAWNDIYAAGLVYGTRDNGLYPTSGAPAYQFRQLTKIEGSKTWTLKPRLMTGWSGDPAVQNSLESDYINSEWHQLLGRVTTLSNGSIVEKWDDFTAADLGANSDLTSWVKETYSVNILYAVKKGGTSVLTANAFSIKTTGYGWRPVLELIPSDTVKDPVNISYSVSGPLGIYLSEGEVSDTEVAQPPISIHVQNYQWDDLQLNYSFVDTAKGITNLTGTTDSPQLKGFTISGSYVA